MFAELLSEIGAALDRRSIPYMLRGHDVRFAAPEDVIIHKVFAGRPRDLEDVRTIALKNPDIDRAYIRRWLQEFEMSSEHAGGRSYAETFDEILRG